MISKMIISFRFKLFLILSFSFFGSSNLFSMDVVPPVSSSEYVRVALVNGAQKITISLSNRYRITTLDKGMLLVEGKKLREVVVYSTGSGLAFGKLHLKIFGVRIMIKKGAYIYVNNRPFRGEVEIIRREDGKLLVVNHLGLEEYLGGVLAREISHRWPIEAIKAQAIAARTFALWRKRENAGKEYDLTADVYSQVYGGKYSEKRRTVKAVRNTKGKVLTYNGEIFPTYYHATCGGYTEDAGRIWNTDIPPLKGGRCLWCKGSPHYTWRAKFLLSDMEKRLNGAGYDAGKISEIRIISRNASKRVGRLEIVGDKARVFISGNAFRLGVGPDRVRSTNFTLTIRDGLVRFSGVGWGHGVGLCQWGAYFMSRDGRSAEEILKFYYPGAEVR